MGQETFCAGIVARNDATFLRASVESIYDLVDEIIIVENGSIDNSAQIAAQLAAEYTKVTFFQLEAERLLADARNKVDWETKCDWIIWWDADFVAWPRRDDGQNSLEELLDEIRANEHLNQVLYGGPNVGPAYDTVIEYKKYQGVSGDTQITRKGFMKFEVKEYIDSRYYTGERRTLYANSPEKAVLLHLDQVKPMSRIILRDLLYKFEVEFRNADRNVQVFGDWIARHHPTFSLKASKEWKLRKIRESLVPYDFEKFGSHPTSIENYLSDPFYTSTLEAGKVSGIAAKRKFPGEVEIDQLFGNLGLS